MFSYANAIRKQRCVDRQIKSRLGTGMQTNLGACNDQSNQTAVVRSRALHALVQALSEVRQWILGIVYCSHSNKQSIFYRNAPLQKLA